MEGTGHPDFPLPGSLMSMSFRSMKRLLEEPLLHFLLLGAGLFAAYALVARPAGPPPPGHIVVSAGRIEHLATGFVRVWQRPPSDTELAGLIDDWVREEIATREAMALGLDKEDTVIRRRLRQKFEFVSDDIAAQAEPTDAELGAFLRAHPDRFRVEPRFTFSQVFLDPTRHGTNLARHAAEMLARLKQAGDAADPREVGDSFLLEPTFLATPAGEVRKQFGEQFATALAGLPPGQWQGPIESGYGAHLVLVRERTEGHVPGLAEARDSVLREWTNARRLEGNERFYRELRKRYTVTVERPEKAKGRKQMAATQ